MPKIFTFITAISLCWSIAIQADVYRSQDADGNITYSDQKPSENATPSRSDNSINYFTPPKIPEKKPARQPASTPETLSTLEAVADQDSEEKMTEQECQELYATSCDKIENWMKYAIEQCGDDSRCSDPAFLEKKYRPRSIKEMQAIARRAGARNNLQDKKISQFLQRKYGNQCEVQAQQYCRTQRSRNCSAQIQAFCNDPRGLDDIFARYDNLTVQEREQIIAEAKALALANGDDPTNYDKLIAGLIDILISQALMGI